MIHVFTKEPLALDVLNGLLQKGTADQDVQLLKTLLVPTDTRSVVATAWNSADKVTAYEIRDGATVVATVTIQYNTDGHATQVQMVCGTITVTVPISWTGDKFNSWGPKVVTGA